MAIVPRDKLGLNFENEFHQSTKIKIGVEGARFCLESWLCKAYGHLYVHMEVNKSCKIFGQHKLRWLVEDLLGKYWSKVGI